MQCGVDEAGKGSVLGPMVVAAVGAKDPSELDLSGIKDSKLLSREERERFFDMIVPAFRHTALVIEAAEIDRMRMTMTMNALVASAHAKVIRRLRASIAYVDACDVIAERFGHMVGNQIVHKCRIVAEHHADETHPIVSAASIVAKVVRDRAVDALAERYGPLGSGYPSDPETVAFLEAWIESEGRPPPCARTSWKTVETMMYWREQTGIFEFSD